MNLAGLSSIFFLATVKFSVSTIPGPGLGLSFVETFLAAFLGGSISATFFYFASEFVIQWAQKKKIKKRGVIASTRERNQKKENIYKVKSLYFYFKIKISNLWYLLLGAFFLFGAPWLYNSR